MKSFLRKINKLNCGWNDVPLDEDAFYRLCRKHKIRLTVMPLSTVRGFYNCTKGKHYIAVDNKLSSFEQAFVMYHEFAHFLMHSPRTEATESFCGSKTHTRDELEADAFAYCALLPLELLKNRDNMEVAETYGMQFFMERLGVYERYGI